MIRDVPITLPNGRIVWMKAGPTSLLPDGYQLIRCAAEIEVDMDRVEVDISTDDFEPFDDRKIEIHLPHIMEQLSAGRKLYAGCMGGTGRTGTILAIIAAQHPDLDGAGAIKYIRTVYKPNAVETNLQHGQVARWSGKTTPVSRLYGEHLVIDDLYYEPPTEEHEPRQGWFTRLWKRLIAG